MSMPWYPAGQELGSLARRPSSSSGQPPTPNKPDGPKRSLWRWLGCELIILLIGGFILVNIIGEIDMLVQGDTHAIATAEDAGYTNAEVVEETWFFYGADDTCKGWFDTHRFTLKATPPHGEGTVVIEVCRSTLYILREEIIEDT